MVIKKHRSDKKGSLDPKKAAGSAVAGGSTVMGSIPGAVRVEPRPRY